MEIPQGTSPEDLRARKKIIADFYANWCAEHPDKKVWNKSLNAYIHVKYQSLNETRGQASTSYESTKAVLRLTEILEEATVAQISQQRRMIRTKKLMTRWYFCIIKVSACW